MRHCELLTYFSLPKCSAMFHKMKNSDKGAVKNEDRINLRFQSPTPHTS